MFKSVGACFCPRMVVWHVFVHMCSHTREGGCQDSLVYIVLSFTNSLSFRCFWLLTMGDVFPYGMTPIV